MKIPTLILTTALLLSGCGEDTNCLQSTGNIVKEKRSQGYFSTITVYDNIDLILSNTGIESVEVEAGENILDGIKMEIVNYNLIIKNKNKCNWLRSYDKKIKVYINQPALVELYNLSNGTVSSSEQLVLDSLIIHNYGNGSLDMNLKCDKLIVDTNFLGDLTFSGEATVVKAHCIRLARLDTRKLKCQDLHITSDAESDAYVYAENSLSGIIRNQGNVFYSGNPTVDVKDEGKGNFIKE